MVVSKHFILTGGRSGSNHLTNSLNKHPSLVNYGEVLGEWTLPYKLYRILRPLGVTSERFIDLLYENALPFYMGQVVSAISHLRNKAPVNLKRRSQIETVGIKDFAFLIYRRRLTSYLADRKDIRVIHLRRINLLHRYLSLVRMGRTGIVKTREKRALAKKLFVDTVDMMRGLKQLAFEESQELDIVSAIEPSRLYSVLYEDYFSSKERMQDILAEILNFLDLSPVPLISDQKKISPDRLEDSIKNYSEVCEALKGGAFEDYLYG